MQVWNVLHAAGWKYRMQKNRHLGIIAHICRAISSQIRHISTMGKKLVKQQYLLHMSLQYGELRPTSGWDHFVSLGHPYKFQRVSRLGSVTVRHSSIGRQPNFAVLNRGRHLYSAGRPSRWALAHISSSCYFFRTRIFRRIRMDFRETLPHHHAVCSEIDFVLWGYSYTSSENFRENP